jgi:hypothetical protein
MLSTMHKPWVIRIAVIVVALMLIISGRFLFQRSSVSPTSISELRTLPVNTWVEVQGVAFGGELQIGDRCDARTSSRLYTYQNDETDRPGENVTPSLATVSIPLVPDSGQWGSFRIRGWLRRAACEAGSPGFLYIEVVDMTPINHPYDCPQPRPDVLLCPEDWKDSS